MKYLNRKILQYLSIIINSKDSVFEISSTNDSLLAGDFNKLVHIDLSKNANLEDALLPVSETPNHILVNGCVHYWEDIQTELSKIYKVCEEDTRLIVIYYSSFWRPVIQFADWLGIRKRTKELNWVSPFDMESLANLSNFELVKDEARISMPIYIPILSNFINKYLAILPVFNIFCLLRISIFRAKGKKGANKPSVSVLVPARNEAGNIERALKEIPIMGPEDELIFVEGNSTDDTWEVIKNVTKLSDYQQKWGGRIKILQQDGKGKGNAVRNGFDVAEKDILMILDADLTVPPFELWKFYNAIVEDKGEFINGSRLVYPMEKQAMRFFNILGNKFFAVTLSYLLGTKLKDTLCGTKVLTRKNYVKLKANRAYFGDFDPFGDFDLIFGASKMGLKFIEVPIKYRDRLYGETNISRWKHGMILLRMTIFAARKIKFI